MNKTLKATNGELRVRVVSGDTERMLNACAGAGVRLWDVQCGTDGEMFASLFERDRDRFEKIAFLCSCDTKTVYLRGGSRFTALLRHRSGILAAAVIVALLLTASGLFIWDIEIYGNETISRAELLRTLEKCGVSEGSFWPSTDAEKIRTRVLIEEQRLAWVSMNVSGSRARVVVLEREEKPEIYRESDAADVTAAKDGVVCGVSVKNGRAEVRIGDTVLRGQTLISGLMSADGQPRRVVRAGGTVIADTWPRQTVIVAPSSASKTEKSRRLSALALKLGKNRLNFGINSRKSTDGCGKITKEYALGVKGLFRFPISVIVEIRVPYETAGEYMPDRDDFERRAEDALRARTDGEILSFTVEWSGERAEVSAHCREDIAAVEEYERNT